MLTLPHPSTALALAAYTKYEQLQIEAGEMGQWVNCLLPRYEDSSSDPWHSQKARCGCMWLLSSQPAWLKQPAPG